MTWPFKCKHPFTSLAVNCAETREVLDADFERVTYNLYCLACQTALHLTHAELIGGTEAFIQRGRALKRIKEQSK